MAVVVAAVEGLYVRGNPMFVETVAASWRYAGRMASSRAPGYDVLGFGDSKMKFGLVPPVLGRLSGRKAYNLALHSGSAPSSYFLFRRALEAGARPRAIVVDYAWLILADGPSSKTRVYPWADLLSLREAAELCWDARDADLFASILVRSVLPSLRGRFEVRAEVLAALREKPTRQKQINLVQTRNWEANSGAHVAENAAAGSYEDTVLPAGLPPRKGTWACEAVNLVYVERLLDLAERHGVTVYWLVPPVAPGLQSKWNHLGDEGLYDQFVRSRLERHANLIVVDGRGAGFAASLFVDGIHLDRDGAIGLSAGLAEVMSRPSAAARARWVGLPPYRSGLGAGLPVEDLAQSRQALESVVR
jgi:hypothetical protein